jgi:hypothetical protein
MVQLFRVVALTVVLLLDQAQPTAAAPEVVQYTLTGGNQFPGPGFEGYDPLVSPGGPIASGSLTVTLHAAGCSSPPVSGSFVCLRNFAFLTTQGQSFGVANRVLADPEKASALTFAAGDSPTSVAVGNLDGDGTFQRPAYRGPGLAIDLHATAYGYSYFTGSGTSHNGTALNLRADEAGRLEPSGTRTPFFNQTRGGRCLGFGCGGFSSASGTFIVGREVPEPTSTSLTLAALVTVTALAHLKNRRARTT